MNKGDILRAARATGRCVPAKRNGWEVRTITMKPCAFNNHNQMTQLLRKIPATIVDMHLMDDNGMVDDVVMEDSDRELKRHLPAFFAAKGRVLKTGLGLGCFVRGCLAKPEVDHITVIEIEQDVIELVGDEFLDNPRVSIIHADALTYDCTNHKYDFCWHDIWTPRNEGLALKHAHLIDRYKDAAQHQGAWMFPRYFKRMLPEIVG